MSDTKVADHEILGPKAEVSHEEAVHQGELGLEERQIEQKLRRKIDCLIMPLVVLVYLMNYIDRNNYAAAKLQGLVEDLHLVGDQYQTGLSILFVGYILAQVPSNLLMNHIGRPSLYLGFFIIAWGLVSALTSQVKSYGSIVACRFILGFVEAPFFAGVLFYLSKWYTKKELALRMSIFYSGSLLSGAFGNLIAAGILSGLAHKRGLDAWQWLYIIEGSITVLIGIIICLVLPDFPQTWRLLTPEERHVANRRLAIEAAEADEDEAGGMSQIKGLKLAMTDVKTYLLALIYMCQTGSAGFQNYFPTLTSTLHYSHVVSLLLVAPPYIFMVVYSLLHNHFSDRLQNRFWFLAYPAPLAIVGFVMYMACTNFGGLYTSFFFMIFVFAQNGTIYSWIASTIPRPPAKRAAVFAFVNSIGNSASIWTPYTYRNQDYPHYRVAMGVNIGFQVVLLLTAFVLRSVLVRENRRLARLEDEDVVLDNRDLARLKKTADVEGIDIAAARRLQKGYRYML